MMGDVRILNNDGKSTYLYLHSIDKEHKWEGHCYRSIMGVSTLHLKIESNDPIEFPLGCYIEEQGYRYTLYYPSSITKRHTKSFEYQLLFHGVEEELKLYKLKDVSGGKPYRLKFFLTAKPIDFLRVIVDTLNLSDEGWIVGDCIEAGEKTLAFHHEDCLSALSRVAEEFNTEWHIEGKQISLGKVSHFQDDPLPMQYGMGNGFRSGVGRRNNADRQPIGKLYVEGGSRNIDRSKYGSPTLLLPKSATISYKGKQYRTDSEGMYITCDGNNYPAEDSFDGSNVYPMREGMVSEVVVVKEGEQTFYDIKDSSIPESLNYNDYRIAGERATIVFQTGALAGREFDLVQTETELTGYIHSERRFKIVPAEIDGFTMPSGTFIPAVGDKYAIFNISLPQEYLSSASQKMLKEAVEYFHPHSEPSFIFDGEVDPIWARKHWLEVGGKLIVGSHILFSDPQFHPEGSVIRINGVMNQLGEPYHIELTLTNAPSAGSLANTLSKLEAEPLLADKRDRTTRQMVRRGWQEAKETQAMLERAVEALGEEFTHGISPVALQTMQVLVGSEAMQFRFVTSKSQPTTAPHIVTWNKVGNYLEAPSGIIQHRTLGINTITPKKKASDYRYWDIPTYRSPALSHPSSSFYLYAEVERVGSAGRFVLSEETRPFEVGDKLNLLVGLLSSERDGVRSFVPMYGFSELTPDGLTTKLIRSADGRTYFDLEQGEIGGNIKFRSGRSLDEWAGETERAIEAEQKAREQADKEARQALEKQLADLTSSTTADNAQLSSLLEQVNRNIANLQDQVDGEVSNWFYPGAPAPDKLPESNWTTNNEKARHIGDTYTSTDTTDVNMGKSWRYTTEFKWQEIHDTLVSQALHRASQAQATADGKSTTYLAKPTKYEVGDQWVVETTQVVNGKRVEAGTVLYATHNSSAYVQAHWVDKLKYASHSELTASERKSKQAWESYAKAQADLAEETAKAHADGKVTAEEQARIDAVKKAVETAKAHAEAQDKLLKTQQEAYADGKITASEKAMIRVAEAKAKLAETNAKAHADGKVTEAEQKAITEAQKLYDEAVAKAKEMDENIQIGGRNLLVNTAGSRDFSFSGWQQYFHDIQLSPYGLEKIKAGGQFYLSALIDRRGATGEHQVSIDLHILTSSRRSGWTRSKMTNYVLVGQYLNIFSSFTLPKDDNVTNAYVRVFQDRSREVVMTGSFSQVFLGIGNKATDWAEAPEDVEARRKAEIDDINSHPPRINSTTKNWEVWNHAEQKYIDTGDTSVGDDGRSPKIVDGFWHVWDGIKYATTNVKAVGIDGVDGKPGKDGKDGKPGRDGRNADPKELEEIKSGLSNANTTIEALQKAQQALDQGILSKADTKDIQYLLNALQKGTTSINGGLVLTNEIALSDSISGLVTSALSGQGVKGAKSLRLGIEYTKKHGTTQEILGRSDEWTEFTKCKDDNERRKWLKERFYTLENSSSQYSDRRDWIISRMVPTSEATALANDGTGHFGELYFDGKRIHFGEPSESYMTVGGATKSESQLVNASTTVESLEIKGAVTRENGAILLDSFSIKVGGNEVKYSGTLSVSASATAKKIEKDPRFVNNGDYFGGGWRPPHYEEQIEEYASASASTSSHLLLVHKRGSTKLREVKSSELSVSVYAEGGQWYRNNHPDQSKLFASDSKSLEVSVKVYSGYVQRGDTFELYLITSANSYVSEPDVFAGENDGYTSNYASVGTLATQRPVDNSKAMIAVGKDRASFFYGSSKYILMNYLRDVVLKVVGNMLIQGNLTVKGELKADGFYACGNVSRWGQIVWSKGRTVSSKRERNGVYVITHNIGHTRYAVSGTIVGNERMFLRVRNKGNYTVTIELHPGSYSGYEDTYPSEFDFIIHAGVQG